MPYHLMEDTLHAAERLRRAWHPGNIYRGGLCQGFFLMKRRCWLWQRASRRQRRCETVLPQGDQTALRGQWLVPLQGFSVDLALQARASVSQQRGSGIVRLLDPRDTRQRCRDRSRRTRGLFCCTPRTAAKGEWEPATLQSCCGLGTPGSAARAVLVALQEVFSLYT